MDRPEVGNCRDIAGSQDTDRQETRAVYPGTGTMPPVALGPRMCAGELLCCGCCGGGP